MTSAFNIDVLAENASRLGMRLQESISEHTRDLTLPRFDLSDDGKDIRKQLDSTSDREKLDALKRLVALISKGRNVSEYFAQVVKNVACSNFEVRKLVYIYILRYAEQEPDLALLSINTFQKDLNDPSPFIRSMALRVLSGIRVPMISSIMMLAVKKCAADPSPYVRNGAALAIPKCYELDTSHIPALIKIIESLLADRSPLPLGSVAVAFFTVCPTRFDLIHPQFRRLCRMLVDIDEWGQVFVIELLVRYSRVMLPRPTEDEMDPDLKLLLSSAEPLLQSRNPATVLAVSRVFYYLGPGSYTTKIINPLLRLLSISKEVERIALPYVYVVSHARPELFSSHCARFYLRSNDFNQTKREKVRILLNLLTVETHQTLLREFIDYAEDLDDSVVADSIRAIGRCARLIPDSIPQCLIALLTMIKSHQDVVVSNAVQVLKALVQSQLQQQVPGSLKSMRSPTEIISDLAGRFDDIRHSEARACVLWLVGQYAAAPENTLGVEGVAPWAPDTLRKGVKAFTESTSLVKLQTITLAAKLLILAPSDQRLILLGRYAFSLARYDNDYDVRDRARTLSGLLSPCVPGLFDTEEDEVEHRGGVILRREQVRLILFEGKAGVIELDSGPPADKGLIGTLELICGRDLGADDILPDWLEQGINSSLRDNAQEDQKPPFSPIPATVTAISSQTSRSIAATPVVLTPKSTTPPTTDASQPWTDLDRFYADAEDDEEDEDEEDDDEEDDSGNEEEDDDGEDEDEDEDEDDEDDDGESSHEDESESEDEEAEGNGPEHNVENQHQSGTSDGEEDNSDAGTDAGVSNEEGHAVNPPAELLNHWGAG